MRLSCISVMALAIALSADGDRSSNSQPYSKFDSPGSTEGDRFGALLGAGYSYMLSKWLNVELGFGFWGGYDSFRSYDCPTCGVTTEKGRRFFLKGEDIILALSIIF